MPTPTPCSPPSGSSIRFREAGEAAEVVALTGSPKVGVVSDRRVAEQFDRVLREHPAEAAYLVSDGAEDEYLFPILASRVRIDDVTRVYIRQSASLESTYYTLVRALKDPKLRAKTVLPFALVMLTLGIAAAGGVIWWGVIGLLILLGIYLIFWTFDIDEALIESNRSASTDVRQGSVAFGFGLFALALVGLGFLSGYNVYVGSPSHTPIEPGAPVHAAGARLLARRGVRLGGRARHPVVLRNSRIPRSFLIGTTSILGIGLVSYGILFTVEYLEGLIVPATLPLVVSVIVGGLALIIGAGVLSQYFKARAAARIAEAAAVSPGSREA